MPGHNPVPADDRRVGHKIPHRFTVVVAKALNKCKNCKKVITLGHKCLRCDGAYNLFPLVPLTESGSDAD
jgi:ribosomal protein L32